VTAPVEETTIDEKELKNILNRVAQSRLSTLKHAFETEKSLSTHEEQFLVVYMLLSSSERLEKLTKWLKWLTVVLAILTAFLVGVALKP
jgi:CRISPR/Cas system-associated protein Cas5 (RAMP superfamily)